MHSEQFPTQWLTVISDPSGSQTALSLVTPPYLSKDLVDLWSMDPDFA